MSKLDDLRIDAPMPRPRRKRPLPWVPVVVVLFIALLVLYFQRDRLAQVLSAPDSQPLAPEALPDDAVAAEPPGPAGSISAAGYLEVPPPGPTVISALVAGKVLKISAVPGQLVSAGEVVARLDSGQLAQAAAVLASRVELAQRRLELKQAGFRREEIAQAEAELESAQAALQQAAADYERGEQLFSEGVIARQQLDALQAARERARAAVAASQSRLELLQAGTRSEDISIAAAELQAARAELQQIQWEIAQCTVRAPEDGVVLEQYAQPGSWVTPGTDNPLSGALLSIFEPTRLQAWVDVNQRDSGSLYVGQQVELTTDAQPLRPVAGQISRIMPQANLQKNTVQVKVAIAEPPADFRPELSVKVVFLAPEDDVATLVQDAATPEDADDD